ncbi:hypothetical protein BCD67_08635 [Oscillatoriales cyanobacterium USR001]|nr:hypothetical protein BCD67_08635 [Oscillatoriales cyanobacterium USR001]
MQQSRSPLPLKRGEQELIKVPLFKGDLGGSTCCCITLENWYKLAINSIWWKRWVKIECDRINKRDRTQFLLVTRKN